MPIPDSYNFQRYLAAKKTVDDRALNRQVWDTLAHALPAGALRVLEIGAGIGTMAERMLDWGLLAEAHYTAIDARPDNIAIANQRLQQLPPGITLDLEAIDLFDFIARRHSSEREHRGWDLLVAHAFLDLMDIPRILPQLFALLRRGGLYYFTLNFDGATLLQPQIDSSFDAHIERLYHRTMDERITGGQPSGDSRAGRHLFGHLRAAGADILAAGSSDWVVFAGPDGYPADEAYFLHFIIHTMHHALTGYRGLDPARFDAWIARRHAQIERGELVYIAHQLDFVGRVERR